MSTQSHSQAGTRAGKKITVSARTDPKTLARHVAMLNRWTKENQASLWPKAP